MTKTEHPISLKFLKNRGVVFTTLIVLITIGGGTLFWKTYNTVQTDDFIEKERNSSSITYSDSHDTSKTNFNKKNSIILAPSNTNSLDKSKRYFTAELSRSETIKSSPSISPNTIPIISEILAKFQSNLTDSLKINIPDVKFVDNSFHFKLNPREIETAEAYESLYAELLNSISEEDYNMLFNHYSDIVPGYQRGLDISPVNLLVERNTPNEYHILIEYENRFTGITVQKYYSIFDSNLTKDDLVGILAGQ